MRPRIEPTLAMLRIGAAAAWAGRAVLLGRGVFYLLVITLLAAFWDLVAAERRPGTLAPLLPAGGLAVYVGVTEWITLSVPSIHLRLEDDIRSRAIEAHLLRPMSYPLMCLAEGSGSLLVRLGTLGAIGLLGLLLSGRAGLPIATWPCLIVLGVLGGLVGTLLFALVGMCAFWVRRTIPIYLFVQKLSFLLGGLFAPLTFYPRWLQDIAEASPFAAQLYWPAIIVTTPGIATALHALMMEVLWIALLTVILTLTWRMGIKRLLRHGL
jgi:ABC-2 type transport system permease protein